MTKVREWCLRITRVLAFNETRLERESSEREGGREGGKGVGFGSSLARFRTSRVYNYDSRTGFSSFLVGFTSCPVRTWPATKALEPRDRRASE